MNLRLVTLGLFQRLPSLAIEDYVFIRLMKVDTRWFGLPCFDDGYMYLSLEYMGRIFSTLLVVDTQGCGNKACGTQATDSCGHVTVIK